MILRNINNEVLYCIYPFLWRFSQHEPFRSAPDHSNLHCVRVYTPKCNRKLQVKDLPKVPTWRLEQDSNPRPSCRKASTLPMCHHIPRILLYYTSDIFCPVRIHTLQQKGAVQRGHLQREEGVSLNADTCG